MMKSFFTLFAFFLSIYVNASDISNYRLIGFSGDAKYLAFERFGTHDGSAFPYSEIMIVDVCKNEYVMKPIITTIEKQVGEDEARNKNKEKAADHMGKYGIIEGNTGDRVFKCKGNCSGEVKFKINDESMDLFLQQLEDEEDCGGVKQKKLVLSLKSQIQSFVLQKDEKVPKSRKCASAYNIEEVHLLDNYIAVVISYKVPGYEGADTRQILVTGCLPSQYK